MNDEKSGVTVGVTSLKPTNVMHQKITNPFHRIIKNSLSEQLILLRIREKELEVWDRNAFERFKAVFGFANEKSRQWILSGVKKEIQLNLNIPISNFIKVEQNIFASVNATDLEHKIYIGNKFIKAPVTGEDSQVITLCHEMSHFDDVLGTKDLGGGAPKVFAKALAEKRDEMTMQSSYNFEMYFI